MTFVQSWFRCFGKDLAFYSKWDEREEERPCHACEFPLAMGGGGGRQAVGALGEAQRLGARRDGSQTRGHRE